MVRFFQPSSSFASCSIRNFAASAASLFGRGMRMGICGLGFRNLVSSQFSSSGYSWWIGLSKVPFTVLTLAPRTTASFPLMISMITVSFHVFLFLLSSWMITADLCRGITDCLPLPFRWRSRRLRMYSRDHRFHIASLHSPALPAANLLVKWSFEETN